MSPDLAKPSKAERRADVALVVNYHEAQLAELLERVREGFDRYASVHRVKTPQYRQVNALSALMLLTALLLELNDLSRDEESIRTDGGPPSPGQAGTEP